jgi:peptidoglycan biosynthesis protein MviN/MurJ (putative lipid II flippase)
MNFKWLWSRLSKGGALLAVLTLGVAALFKIAAFGREVFIAAWFGVSSFTDAYFVFQQFPLMLATFMFGAFGLAFAPVYADEKRKMGRVEWLPGLTIYGGTLGLLGMLLMMIGTPWLLRAFGLANAGQGASTVVILSCSFAPVIWLGIWAGAAIAEGKNLLAMFITGLPYLLMTALLAVLYGLGKLDAFSLPISFMAGFGLIGLYTLPGLLRARPTNGDAGGSLRPSLQPSNFRSVIDTWKMPGFRRFLQQLGASSIENLGFSGNQLLMVYFVAHDGAGAVSANTFATRVGMIGFNLLSQPLAQLIQAKLCAAPEGERAEMLRKWLPAISGAVLAFALLLYVLRTPITSLVYLHGKFSAIELSRVIDIVPAWIAYFVVASLNGIVARYLFTTAQGNEYVRRQLWAYGAANLIRIALWGRLSAPTVIWCSVLCEGCALLVSLRSCFQQTGSETLEPALAGVQEA